MTVFRRTDRASAYSAEARTVCHSFRSTGPATDAFLPILIDMSKAEVHILEDEAESECYIRQLWFEAMNIYFLHKPPLKLPREYEKELANIQRTFMPEDDRLGMMIGFLERTTAATVCSRMLYKEAFDRNDEPNKRDLQEINEIMNAGIASKEIVGWRRLDKPVRFREYGTQRGWERTQMTLDSPRYSVNYLRVYLMISLSPSKPKGLFLCYCNCYKHQKDFNEVYRERKGFVPVCNTAVVTRERERKSRIERN